MDILLCSTNDTVIRRWAGSLDSSSRTFEADSLATAYRVLDSNDIALTLLHRSLINEKQIRELLSAKPTTKVFILSDRPSNNEGIACLKLGCSGYANAYIAQPRLSLAIQAIKSGLIWTGTSLMQHMIQASASGPGAGEDDTSPTSPVLEELSKREYQVAALIAEGLNNRDVAARLDITERTVKAHLSSAYSKTDTKSRLGLARLFSTQT